MLIHPYRQQLAYGCKEAIETSDSDFRTMPQARYAKVLGFHVSCMLDSRGITTDGEVFDCVC